MKKGRGREEKWKWDSLKYVRVPCAGNEALSGIGDRKQREIKT